MMFVCVQQDVVYVRMPMSEMVEDCCRCRQWCPYDPGGPGITMCGAADDMQRVIQCPVVPNPVTYSR